MGRVTLADVQAASTEAYRATARAWETLAASLDEAYERYLTGQQRIDRSGRGQAIQAAVRRMVASGHELSNVCQPARQIAHALHAYAHEVTTLQRRLDLTLTSADAYGIRVDLLTAGITAPTSPPTPMNSDQWRVFVDETRADLEQLLTRARRLDAMTAKRLRSHQPAPGVGFGRDPAGRVSRATVQAQTGRAPAEVFAWWQGLSPEQQEWALREHADLLGPLNGIPTADRDKANRLNLDSQLRTVREQADDIEYLLAHPENDPYYSDPMDRGQDRHIRQHELRELRAALRTSEAGLLAVRDQLSSAPDTYLLYIDGAGDGRVAIAVGNPDHAAHTAVFVPGVGTDLLDVGGDLDRATKLRQHADDLTPASGDVSVVYWLGYDPPDSLADGWDHGPSHDGAPALTSFVDGLRATHVSIGDHLSVVGHSYGSTVVAEAAKTGGLDIDDFITAGSPGLHSQHVDELNLPPGHVWVGLADDDPIRFVPDWVHGAEPYDPDYGATRYRTDTSGHSGYWTAGSDSITNQAKIITGRYDEVTVAGAPR